MLGKTIFSVLINYCIIFYKKGESYPSYPFLITVFSNFNQPLCYGVLLEAKWVLTPAHCIDMHLKSIGQKPDEEENFMRIALFFKPYQLTPVEKFYKHPTYDNFSLLNDIGILRLETRIEIFDGSNPVVLLPAPESRMRGLRAFSVDKKWVNVKIVERTECLKWFPYLDLNHICVHDSNLSICGGLSGVPLVSQHTAESMVIFGLYSFGRHPCGTAPTVFTKIQPYISYIKPYIEYKIYQ